MPFIGQFGPESFFGLSAKDLSSRRTWLNWGLPLRTQALPSAAMSFRCLCVKKRSMENSSSCPEESLENRHFCDAASRESLRYQDCIDHGSGFPEFPKI
jgi:hypothetical protein